jgi:hypothetical protein
MFEGYITASLMIHILDLYLNSFSSEHRQSGKLIRYVTLQNGVMRGGSPQRKVGKNMLRLIPGHFAQLIGMPNHTLVKGHSLRQTGITVLAQKNFSNTMIKGVSGNQADYFSNTMIKGVSGHQADALEGYIANSPIIISVG